MTKLYRCKYWPDDYGNMNKCNDCLELKEFVHCNTFSMYKNQNLKKTKNKFMNFLRSFYTLDVIIQKMFYRR